MIGATKPVIKPVLEFTDANKDKDPRVREEVLQNLEPEERFQVCKAILLWHFGVPLKNAPRLHDNFARVLAILIGPKPLRNEALEGNCRTFAEQLLAAKVLAKPHKANDEYPSAAKLLSRLLRDYGFANSPGVYFAGDAGDAFGRVVTNKLLFVDGISSVHGEFSHSIQWLYLAYINDGLPDNSPLKIKGDTIAELYAASMTFKGKRQVSVEKGNTFKPDEKNYTMWDVCVDCFKPGQHADPKGTLLTTLFSRTMRSPAVFQHDLMNSGSEIYLTYLSQLLIQRANRLRFGGKPLSEIRHADLQKYYKQRVIDQMAQKPRLPVPGARGPTDAFVRDPLPAGPLPHRFGNADATAYSRQTRGVLAIEDLNTLAARANQQRAPRDDGNNNNAPVPPDGDIEGMWLRIHHPKPTGK